jgi:type IV pilus assembly protein PilV
MSGSRMRTERGFSLLELLVALTVIAVGMLGIARMHALAIQSAGSAGARSLVALETAGMAAAMHANHEYWSRVTGDNLTTTAYFATGATPTLSIASTGACTSSADPAPSFCANQGASASVWQDLAVYDLGNYASALAQFLPAGNVAINCRPTTSNLPQSCTITVSWLEQAFGAGAAGSQQTSDAALAAGTAVSSSAPLTRALQQPQYTLYVTP